MDGATIVISGRAQVIEVQYLQFAAGHRDIFVGRHARVGGKPAYAVVGRSSAHAWDRVINVNVMVVEVVGIERHAKQTALTVRIHRQGHEIGSQKCSTSIDD